MPFGRRSFLLRPFLMAPSPGVREGSHPLALSRGVAGRSQVRHTPRARPQNFDRSVSLSQPGCERVHALSRSPMGSQDAAECAIRCRARPQDFDCSVSFSRCQGCERVHTLSRSPMGSQDAAESYRAFLSFECSKKSIENLPDLLDKFSMDF